MALRPLGDVCMVELSTDEYNFGGDDKANVDNGILVQLPDKFNYFGFFSFAFEESFMSRKELDDLYKYYEQLKGKRVFWPSLSEKGMVFKEGNKRYAMIKLTSIIGCAEPGDGVHNVYDGNNGGYSA